MSDIWRSAPADLLLAPDEVHVWRAPLDVDAAEERRLRALMSEEERARADRFHFEIHRQHFVAGRGRLRLLLARYLGGDPDQIALGYGAQGKPFVPGATVEFNLSHSGGLVLYAFAERRALGIDIEEVRPEVDCAALAARFFAPAEAARLERLDRSEQRDWFFACWTCKEAFVKALGGGLSLPLDAFEVVPSLASTPVELRIPGDEAAQASWHLEALPIDAGYRAALATAHTGDPARVRLWRWNR